ncbi:MULTISPECIES: 2-phospho-L-lactate guanylyltransferase [unclassified Rhodococcus (in: high G+C Gram-positive bacteria)]|uniref:2-phospho-L-lactate guanylyltransferase n=1 Tax=unclassified Rhodococcus (in: high G+C Gram-positive bacteria) TaxID=192944 RepID=UPI000E0B00FE|nr:MULTISPECIES: 2-phospho-L-lactate guanylyltransferase [unclassified Rhodococcus (in: high G+C Gram-positive bacteria)]QKT12364.1 2-phospho-L-lactate guanylyltransferase [Rhodococcus sp. W8901]RDI22471.1 2-phospho-L-lactate guanylyltransferase [Rhodococcus sp. AG1013]
MKAEHRSQRPVHTHVLIAVKELRLAKSRLAESLSAADRTDLVVAMLHDTLATLVGAGVGPGPDNSFSGITVVTPDPMVATIADQYGVSHLPDPVRAVPGESSLNAALAAAESSVQTDPDRTDLVALQADLPALRADELLEALAAARKVGRAIVVDHTGTGTAALFACGPGNALDPRFGTDSAARHIASGAYALDGDWPGLRQDVDTVADLAAAARLGLGPATRAALEHMRCTPGVRRL